MQMDIFGVKIGKMILGTHVIWLYLYIFNAMSLKGEDGGRDVVVMGRRRDCCGPERRFL